MGICYIVGASEIYGSFSPCEGDLVIAADGGLDRLREFGITPNLIIGDLDSISGDLPEGIELLRHPIEKDETDSYLAYLEGVRRGYKSFVLYGCTGGREDHTFANYSLLLHAKINGNDMLLVSDCAEWRVIKNERITLRGRQGATVSIFAFGSECKGVSIDGLYYTAKDITLTEDFPLGVSNSFTDKEASVEVLSGTLLIMTER